MNQVADLHQSRKTLFKLLLLFFFQNDQHMFHALTQITVLSLYHNPRSLVYSPSFPSVLKNHSCLHHQQMHHLLSGKKRIRLMHLLVAFRSPAFLLPVRHCRHNACSGEQSLIDYFVSLLPLDRNDVEAFLPRLLSHPTTQRTEFICCLFTSSKHVFLTKR